eukprot:SM000040S14792  [mRNA]  locus=s40:296036:297158:- [translate_table: standard]
MWGPGSQRGPLLSVGEMLQDLAHDIGDAGATEQASFDDCQDGGGGSSGGQSTAGNAVDALPASFEAQLEDLRCSLQAAEDGVSGGLDGDGAAAAWPRKLQEVMAAAASVDELLVRAGAGLGSVSRAAAELHGTARRGQAAAFEVLESSLREHDIAGYPRNDVV